MSAASSGRIRVRLYSPIPPAREDGHGALKLDWRSEVGRTGVLLDWRVPVAPVDAGVPPEVARMLAAGLAAVATVTGCTLHLPPHVGPSWTAVPGGHGCRFAAPWWRSARYDIGLFATQNADVLAGAFEDESFAWWNEGQALFLSPPNRLPQLDRALVESCLRLPIGATLAQLAGAGVVGLVSAGVDGDVAGLYLLDPTWRAPIVRALADAVTDAGGVWEELDGMTHPILQAAGVDARARDERATPA